MIVRVIGRVDTDLLATFMTKITDMTKKAKKMKITTPDGTDLEFENKTTHPMS